MKKKAWQTQLWMFSSCSSSWWTHVSTPCPSTGLIPASLTRGFKKSPSRVTLVWPPHLQGIVDSREPSRLVFGMRKIQVSWFVLTIGTGWKVGGLALAVVTGWLQVFEKAQVKPSPLAPAHFTPTYWASRLSHSGPCTLCRKNRWEHFFYIGNFKTIITLCVKNVQRNL